MAVNTLGPCTVTFTPPTLRAPHGPRARQSALPSWYDAVPASLWSSVSGMVVPREWGALFALTGSISGAWRYQEAPDKVNSC